MTIETMPNLKDMPGVRSKEAFEKEIQPEVNYLDIVYNNLYQAKNTTELDQKLEAIKVQYKDNKIFDINGLFLIYFGENYYYDGEYDTEVKTTENELFKNIKNIEDLYGTINYFYQRPKIKSNTEGQEMLAYKLFLENLFERRDTYEEAKALLTIENTEKLLYIDEGLSLNPQEKHRLEAFFFGGYAEIGSKVESTQLQLILCKKFDEIGRDSPDQLDDFIKANYCAFARWYIVKIPSAEILQQQGLQTGKTILDNFDRLDDKSFAVILACRNSSFIKFYRKELFEKIKTIAETSKPISTSKIETIMDFFRRWIYLNGRWTSAEITLADKLEKQIIENTLTRYDTIEKKISFLRKIEYARYIPDILCQLPSEDYKIFLIAQTAKEENDIVLYFKLISEQQKKYPNFHDQYIDFCKQEIIPKLSRTDQMEIAQDCPELGYTFETEKIQFIFQDYEKFTSRAEKTIYIEKILETITAKTTPQADKQRLLEEFTLCLTKEKNPEIIDDSYIWGYTFEVRYGNDINILEWIDNNANLLITKYPSTTQALIQWYGFRKSSIAKIMQTLDDSSEKWEVNLLHSALLWSLLQYGVGEGIDDNTMIYITTLIKRYTSLITAENINHTDIVILSYINKLSTLYPTIEKPNMQIAADYLATKWHMTNVYDNQVYDESWNHHYSKTIRQLAYLLENQEWLGIFQDLINNSFYKRTRDEYIDWNSLVKNMYVILKKDPTNEWAKLVLLEIIKDERKWRINLINTIEDLDRSVMQDRWPKNLIDEITALGSSWKAEDIKGMLKVQHMLHLPMPTDSTLRYIQHPDAEIRALAVKDLDVWKTIERYEQQNINIKDFIDMLINLLEDDSWIVRKEVLKKINQIDDSVIAISGKKKSEIYNEAIKNETYRTGVLEQATYEAQETDIVRSIQNESLVPQSQIKTDWQLDMKLQVIPWVTDKETFAQNMASKQINYTKNEKPENNASKGSNEKKEKSAFDTYEFFLRKLFKFSSKKMYEFTEMMIYTWGITKEEGRNTLLQVQNLSGVTIVEDEQTRKDTHEKENIDAYGVYNPTTNGIEINIQGIEAKAKKENKDVLYVLADVFLHEIIHAVDYGVQWEHEKWFNNYIVEYTWSASIVDLDEVFTEIFSSLFQVYSSSDEFKQSFLEAEKRWMLRELFLQELNDSYEYYTDKQEIIGLMQNAPIEKLFSIYITGDIKKLKTMIKELYGSETKIDDIFPRKR